MRDDVTGHHVVRLGRFAAIIARELGFSDERAIWLEHAAQLHVVGKIGIADAILHKPDKLTDDEFRTIQGHCLAGARVLEQQSAAKSGPETAEKSVSPLMKLAATIARSHHEKWDGSGYPVGLRGEQIPLEGRITAVADVFDALSNRRPYKAPIPVDECMVLMEAKRGSHFAPAVLDAFFRCRAKIVQTAVELADKV